MKLIVDKKDDNHKGQAATAIAPVPVSEVMATQVNVSDHQPDQETPAVTISSITLLSWKAANLPIRKTSINDQIKKWMDHDVSIRNYIHTAITCFSITSLEEWKCPLPDQWINDMGSGYVTFEKKYLNPDRGIENCIIHIYN